MSILEVKGVNKRFGGLQALGDVNLSVKENSVHAIIGPNGAGKSTLLRALAGLLPLSAGDLSLAGAPLKGGLRGESLFVGHQPALKAVETVAETLAFWGQMAGGAARVADEALKAWRLMPLADLPCRHLSEGQRRRVALARLNLTDAPVWLLDEPTVALDTNAQSLLAERLSVHLKGGGMAVIATHDADDLTPGAQTLELSRPVQ